MPDTAGPTATQAPHQQPILDRMTLVPAGKRLRAVFGGETVAESEDALVLDETGYPARVYFPPRDVRMDLLEPTDHRSHCPWKGDAVYWTLAAGGETRENGAWAYPEPLAELAAIRDYLSFFDDIAVEG